jgi:hypothetical protein
MPDYSRKDGRRRGVEFADVPVRVEAYSGEEHRDLHCQQAHACFNAPLAHSSSYFPAQK